MLTTECNRKKKVGAKKRKLQRIKGTAEREKRKKNPTHESNQNK